MDLYPHHVQHTGITNHPVLFYFSSCIFWPTSSFSAVAKELSKFPVLLIRSTSCEYLSGFLFMNFYIYWSNKVGWRSFLSDPYHLFGVVFDWSLAGSKKALRGEVDISLLDKIQLKVWIYLRKIKLPLSHQIYFLFANHFFITFTIMSLSLFDIIEICL